MMAADAQTQQPVRVMVVDDSAVIRGLMTRAFKEDPGIDVVASAANGVMALQMITKQPIDVIVLDIEMPEMDGITALPKLLEASPGTKVIMASTLTLRNADISMKALSLGASDYIPKPSTKMDLNSANDFYRELNIKVKALGAAAQRRVNANMRPVAATGTTPRAATFTHTPRPAKIPGTQTWPTKYPTIPPKVLAIGSSTGGPQALLKVFEQLKGKLVGVPIFITQHMPPTFTTILAEHIVQSSARQGGEAKSGEVVMGGRVYLAPGDFHMVMEKHGHDVNIHLNQDPPVNFCRPAVDPMMKSLAAVYGRQLLAVILTGMGSDGLEGCKEVIRLGGTVIAQDEASSVVWGMPKAVAESNICSAVLPLNDIAPYIIQAFQS